MFRHITENLNSYLILSASIAYALLILWGVYAIAIRVLSNRPGALPRKRATAMTLLIAAIYLVATIRGTVFSQLFPKGASFLDGVMITGTTLLMFSVLALAIRFLQKQFQKEDKRLEEFRVTTR